MSQQIAQQKTLDMACHTYSEWATLIQNELNYLVEESA